MDILKYKMPKKITIEYELMISLPNMYRSFSKVQHSDVYFDFTDTQEVEKGMLAVLGLIFTKIKSQGNRVYLRAGNENIREIFYNYNFIKFDKEKENIPPNYIKHESFNADENDRFRDYFLNEIKEIKNEEGINYITTHIMEIFLNVKTHARNDSERGKYGNKEVFCSGYYDKNKKYLSFMISNNGITFEKNITKRKKIKRKNSFEYIEWAIKEAHSTTQNRPGGAGLAMVVDLISKSGGELCICSGRGFYNIKYSNGEVMDKRDLLTDFPGTIVYIKVPIKFINEIEIVNSEDELTIDDILS